MELWTTLAFGLVSLFAWRLAVTCYRDVKALR